MVIKRTGEMEQMDANKIEHRLRLLSKDIVIQSWNEHLIDYEGLVDKIVKQLYDKIPTTQIDELASEQCISMMTMNPIYGELASYLVASNHQKNTSDQFSEVVERLYRNEDEQGKKMPIVNKEFYEAVKKQEKELNEMIDYKRDYNIDYFGYQTLKKGYLNHINGLIIERPQHLWMRVAVALHHDDLYAIKETYDLMSNKFFIHATPTLFNAGAIHQQLSSCFLVAMESDSIPGIYSTLTECANISKLSGGIGIHIHNIRASNSRIKGTNGKSAGIVPMLRVFNATAKYVDQAGKRSGSFVVYLEPWHADVENFLELKKNHGDEEQRARFLFYALWIPDEFMKRVEEDGEWTLMSPDEAPGLADVWGEEFEKLYKEYENDVRKRRKVMKARELWLKILDAQMETGVPYLLYKDAANRKSNQKNLGTIKSSNLCTEIIEYSDEKETAVCNLASIVLPKCLMYYGGGEITRHGDESARNENVPRYQFDFGLLHKVTKVVTRNLNKVIDNTQYPTEKSKRSNMRHRPIGIGVQGLADTFASMGISFDSDIAKELNKNIFETMYHAAVEASMELSKEEGPYSTFKGSPASRGELQFDLWGIDQKEVNYDWNKLKQKVMKYGMRNSLLMAPMPTASTSQILGYNECIEPFTNNVYSRNTLAGAFMVVNRYLVEELMKLKIYNKGMKDKIIAMDGSIQEITEIPKNIRDRYKTVWELSMKTLIDMAADRGPYICQSQSMNLWKSGPTYQILGNMHMYAWKKGLKTGMYYLRSRAKHQAQKFTIEPELIHHEPEHEHEHEEETELGETMRKKREYDGDCGVNTLEEECTVCGA